MAFARSKLADTNTVGKKIKLIDRLHLGLAVSVSKGLPEIKLSQFMDSTRLLLPLLPWEFDIFLVGSPEEHWLTIDKTSI